MSVSRNKVTDFLMSAKTMIENALSDQDVKTALAKYGYDEARLQAGKALYDQNRLKQNSLLERVRRSAL